MNKNYMKIFDVKDNNNNDRKLIIYDDVGEEMERNKNKKNKKPYKYKNHMKQIFFEGRHNNITIIGPEMQKVILFPDHEYCSTCKGFCIDLAGKSCNNCNGAGQVLKKL